MAKHGIRAPKAPKGEDPSVTINNQDMQIKALINRCEELRKERDELNKSREAMEEAWVAANEMASGLAESLSKLQEGHSRLLGWQNCAREVIKIMAEK